MSYRHLFKILQWGLILFCLAFAIVGGVVAERALELLHCQPHANPALRSCAWLTNALGLKLTPFLSAGGVTDYPFVLLHNFWALITLWVLALVALRRADSNAATATSSTATTPGRHRPAASRITGVDMLRWAARATFWLLLLGLVGFCVAFGTPILGNQVAREVLAVLGCSPGSFDPFSSPCMSAPGFWTHRLALYAIPLAGPLLAPLWLVMAFWDVLTGWMLLTALAYLLQSHLARQRSGR